MQACALPNDEGFPRARRLVNAGNVDLDWEDDRGRTPLIQVGMWGRAEAEVKPVGWLGSGLAGQQGARPPDG